MAACDRCRHHGRCITENATAASGSECELTEEQVEIEETVETEEAPAEEEIPAEETPEEEIPVEEAPSV